MNPSKQRANQKKSAARAKPPAANGNESARKRGARALEGEGSYSATRSYNRHLKKDLEQRDVGASAERARRALDGPEGAKLRRAEERGKAGPKGRG